MKQILIDGRPVGEGAPFYTIAEIGSNFDQDIDKAKRLVDLAIDSIILISSEGIVDSYNKAAERMFGYQAEEVIGKNINMLMPSPYASEHDGYLENYMTSGIKKIIGTGREVEGKRKDGTTFRLHLSVSEVELEGKKMFTGIARELS